MKEILRIVDGYIDMLRLRKTLGLQQIIEDVRLTQTGRMLYLGGSQWWFTMVVLFVSPRTCLVRVSAAEIYGIV